MRDKLFSIIFCLILVFIVASSSLNIQVIQGAQLRNDLTSQFRTQYIKAQRGLIYDRNGKKLAENKSTYTLYIHPTQIKDEAEMVDLMNQAGISDIDAAKEIFISKRSFDEALIEKDFNNPTFVTKYFSQPNNFKGLEIREEFQRSYVEKNIVSHLLGYTGEVGDGDIKLGYRQGTEIGKAGVELSYDDYLRGQDGKQSVDNETGKAVTEADPVSGSNLYLSIDLDIQKKLRDLLIEGASTYKADGAVGILQNVENGEILAYVSLPDYDNNLFVGGIGVKDYEKLNADPKHPQINRITDAVYPPGSVFKLVTSSALLESKAITKSTTFPTGGTFQYGGVTFRDFSNINQGVLNVVGGLCRSSNIFMMKSSLQMEDTTKGHAIDELDKYASTYGLAQKTGIDLPEGNPGQISSPSVKKDLTDEPWLNGDLLNASIGQGYTLVSPIQIQSMVTAVANGGNILQPHVLKSVGNNDKSVNSIVRNKVDVSADNMDIVKEGMHCAVHEGIISELNSPYVDVAAKSGTAEFGAPDASGAYPNRHGWVTGYFPYNNPKYSFTLLLEKGGSSNNTAKVARTFIDWLYHDYHIDQKL